MPYKQLNLNYTLYSLLYKIPFPTKTLPFSVNQTIYIKMQVLSALRKFHETTET